MFGFLASEFRLSPQNMLQTMPTKFLISAFSLFLVFCLANATITSSPPPPTPASDSACLDPPPSPNFSCNNETSFWEIDSLTIPSGKSISFDSPSLVRGDLVLAYGSTITFTGAYYLYVGGCASVEATINLNFGKNSETTLFQNLTSEKMTTMPLILGSDCLTASNVKFNLQYTGGCTSLSGALTIQETDDPDFPRALSATNLKKKGTGSCHWIWVTLSGVGAAATLIIVPLLESYVWKITD